MDNNCDDEYDILNFASSYFSLDHYDDDNLSIEHNNNTIIHKPLIKEFIKKNPNSIFEQHIPQIPLQLNAKSVSRIKKPGSQENVIFHAQELYGLCLKKLKELEKTIVVPVPLETPDESINIISKKLEEAGYDVLIEIKNVPEHLPKYHIMCVGSVDKIFMTISNPYI
ncbi:putative orfan [Tupanvirus soda lake]|uniref:Orfan n=1 Tax=Tupanvirus deep ocean TaxID=2126984 RepID=A0AC59HBZ4_9VIRU|nr:putative orfan [Tupanvirus soda lake]AUL77993.2 putative orfan [Tupanvirus soda lake]